MARPQSKGTAGVKIHVESDGAQALKEIKQLRKATVREFNRMGKRMDQLSKTAARNEGRFRRAMKGMQKAAQGLRFVAFGAGFYVATRQLNNMVRYLNETTRHFAAFENRINVATEQLGNWRVEMEYVDSVAHKLNLPLISLRDSYAKFAVAALKSNLTMEETRAVFEGVAKAVRSNQLSADQTRLVFLALEQIANKGIVSMEELRRQMGERIPGAFQIAADSMGMTGREFSKLVAEGKVLSGEFLPKFAAELERVFGPQATSAAQRGIAQLDGMRNAYTELGQAMAGPDWESAVGDFAEQASELARNLEDSAEALGDMFSWLTKIAGVGVGWVSDIVKNEKRYGERQQLDNFYRQSQGWEQMRLNPESSALTGEYLPRLEAILARQWFDSIRDITEDWLADPNIGPYDRSRVLEMQRSGRALGSRYSQLDPRGHDIFTSDPYKSFRDQGLNIPELAVRHAQQTHSNSIAGIVAFQQDFVDFLEEELKLKKEIERLEQERLAQEEQRQRNLIATAKLNKGLLKGFYVTPELKEKALQDYDDYVTKIRNKANETANWFKTQEMTGFYVTPEAKDEALETYDEYIADIRQKTTENANWFANQTNLHNLRGMYVTPEAADEALKTYDDYITKIRNKALENANWFANQTNLYERTGMYVTPAARDEALKALEPMREEARRERQNAIAEAMERQTQALQTQAGLTRRIMESESLKADRQILGSSILRFSNNQPKDLSTLKPEQIRTLMQERQREIENFANEASRNMTNAVRSWVNGTKTIEEATNSMVQNIAAQILDTLVYDPIQGLISGALESAIPKTGLFGKGGGFGKDQAAGYGTVSGGSFTGIG